VRPAVLVAKVSGLASAVGIALVEEIWDSIAAESAAVPLTTPQGDELGRRFADHAAHPNEVLSWDEVKASLDERLKKSRCASRFTAQRVMILGMQPRCAKRGFGLRAEFRAEVEAAGLSRSRATRRVGQNA
jgi:putative addiction module component (TIGR02574 family)